MIIQAVMVQELANIKAAKEGATERQPISVLISNASQIGEGGGNVALQ